MNKALLIYLSMIILLTGSIIGLTFFSSKSGAQGTGIVVENADYVSTNTTEYSAGLINTAKNVTPRTVVEYADFNSKLDLNKSDYLNQAADIVSARTIVEYADSILEHSLQSATLPDIEPRIIVEYADFIFGTDLGPKPMEDIAPPRIENVFQQPANDSVYPEDKVEVYANVTDDISGVKQVTLNYTNGNGTWITVDMTNLEGNVWNATIPTFPYCTDITYVIIAEDNADNTITTEETGHDYQYHVIPEFPSAIILPLFMGTTLAVIVYRRKHSM